MEITLQINNQEIKSDIDLGDSLLKFLRNNHFFGAKFGGCQEGECGACTVLLDGQPINSCSMLAIKAVGHSIITIESIGEHPEQGWKKTTGLSNLQKAFVESGAIQCGYCTPAMILSANSLIQSNQNPSEDEIRDGISGVLCRCTGYEKPVKAIKSIFSGNLEKMVSPQIESNIEGKKNKTIGKNEPKVDAIKLVQGKPAFTDDFDIAGMLYAKVLHSPYAHAEIT